MISLKEKKEKDELIHGTKTVKEKKETDELIHGGKILTETALSIFILFLFYFVLFILFLFSMCRLYSPVSMYGV